MITVINKPSNRFTIVSNTIARDIRLSCGAKGVALIILHFPENIVPTLSILRHMSPKDGRDKLRKYLSELEECGYLLRDIKRGKNGKFEGAFWTFDSDPTIEKPITEEPDTGLPGPGNPTSVNTTIYNTSISKTRKDKNRKTKNEPSEPLSGSSEEENFDKSQFSLEQEEITEKSNPEENKIPTNKIFEYFKQKHKELRGIDPIFSHQDIRIQKSHIKNFLWKNLKSEKEIYRYVDALIVYCKKNKNDFGKSYDIVPTSLSSKMLRRLPSYLDKDYDFVPTQAKEVVHNKKESFEEIL
jgi:hypothetical protein